VNFLVRRRAAETLARIGPAAAPAVPELIDALSDDQYAVHKAAENALTRIGAPAVSALTRGLSTRNEQLRRRIVSILGHLGPSSAPALVQTLRKDESSFIRLSAIESLGQLQPLPVTVVPALIGALSDLDEGVRGAACDVLGSLGSAAQSAEKSLALLSTSDPDSLVRRKAQDALKTLAPAKP